MCQGLTLRQACDMTVWDPNLISNLQTNTNFDSCFNGFNFTFHFYRRILPYKLLMCLLLKLTMEYCCCDSDNKIPRIGIRWNHWYMLKGHTKIKFDILLCFVINRNFEDWGYAVWTLVSATYPLLLCASNFTVNAQHRK